MSINKTQQNVLKTFRIIIGLIFIFSGLVKGIDPLGTTYKLGDYFHAFHLSFLEPLSFTFSIILNMSEFLIGVGLLVGVFLNLFTWLAAIYMLIFTPLTFILAIYNPVTDCGCFGDAIILTNWQTFFKNLVIVGILIPVFYNRKRLKSLFGPNLQYLIAVLAVSIFLKITVHSYRHLPSIDFRPYKTGVYIPDGMTIPTGALTDSFAYSFIYEKNKLQKEFALEEIASLDSSWQWVDTKIKLVKKGYTPPIHDFSFTNAEGVNITDSILYDTSCVFLTVAYKLDKAKEKGMKEIKTVYDFAKKNSYQFYVATASNFNEASLLNDKLSLPYSYCNADNIMLKTVVRANPGLVLIKNGTIVAKWHYNDLPSHKTLLQLTNNI